MNNLAAEVLEEFTAAARLGGERWEGLARWMGEDSGAVSAKRKAHRDDMRRRRGWRAKPWWMSKAKRRIAALQAVRAAKSKRKAK